MKIAIGSMSPFTALAALFLAFPLPAAAAVGSWTPLGPDGGSIRALAVHPRTPEILYAGTMTNGVFKSIDGGRTWIASNQGLGLAGQTVLVNAVEIDPLRPETVYAVTLTGFFRSTDGGRRWVSSTRGVSADNFYSLALDPRNPRRLYLGTSAGVFRSGNGGASWQRAGNLILAGGFTALAVDPTFGWIYAGTDGGHRLRFSQDGGTRWQELSQGLSPGLSFWSLEHATVAGRVVLFAGTSRGLYRSDNRGLRWSRVGARHLTGVVESLAFDGRTGWLYAGTRGQGIFASRDRGATWRPASAGLGELNVKALATGPGAVYAGTLGFEVAPGGLYRSSDLGASWLPSQKGLTALRVWKLAASPAFPDLVYASALGGLFRSRDAGQSWQLLRSFPGPGIVREGIALDPRAPATVYAASFQRAPGGVGGQGTFLRSDDFGQNWQAFPLAEPLERLWVDDDATLWGISVSYLYRSDDRGATWSRQALEADSRVQLWLGDVQGDPRSPATLYVAGGQTNGFAFPYAARVYRSDDGGQSWQRKDAGLTAGRIVRLALDPADSTLYAVTLAAVYRSRDRGETWELLVTTEFADFASVLPSPAGSGTIYAATNSPETGVLVSTDDGETWTPVNQGLGVARRVTDLAADPGAHFRIYAATLSGGVFSFESR